LFLTFELIWDFLKNKWPFFRSILLGGWLFPAIGDDVERLCGLPSSCFV
jgi:hypothetical protein